MKIDLQVNKSASFIVNQKEEYSRIVLLYCLFNSLNALEVKYVFRVSRDSVFQTNQKPV